MKSNDLSSSDSWTQGNAVLLHVSHLAFLECSYLTEHCLKSTIYPLSFFLPLQSQDEPEIRCLSQCHKSLLGRVELNTWRPHRVNEKSVWCIYVAVIIFTGYCITSYCGCSMSVE